MTLRDRLHAVLALSLLLAAAGCAPDFRRSPTAVPAILPSPSPARIDDAAGSSPAIVMADGARLALRVWLPSDRQTPKAVIVAIHGFNDYSRAFTLPATTWAGQGIATYAYDQRGFGANPNPGRWPGSRSLCLDIATTVSLVQQRWPTLPVFLLGESMGGAEVMDLMAGTCGVTPPHLAGVILAAPAVWGRRTMPAVNRMALWFAARVLPSARFTGSGFHILASNNIPMLRQLGRDPLFIKATRSDTIFGLVDVMDAGYAAPVPSNTPVLLLYGAHDELIPPEAMRDVARRFAAAKGGTVRIAFYRHGWHMLLRDLEHETVATDVSHWMADPKAPLPSGADTLAPAFLSGALPVEDP